MNQTKDNDNPFPGLRPFHEEENYLFFGRESQIDDLINKLSNNKFLAVVGTSGSGKSSLVNCGLFPALHGGYMSGAGSNWRIAKFRPGNDPILEMALKLAEKNILFKEEEKGEKQNKKSEIPLSSIIQTNLLRSKLGLIETFKQARLQSDENLLIVVDQFEELFRFKNLKKENKKQADNYLDNAYAFVNLLLSAANQTDVHIYIVITMRSDFLGDCSTLRGLPEAINKGQYLVPRMKRRERQKAIVGPIEVAGATISNRLLMRLVNDVGDNPDQLSILQHALNRTWAEWQKTGDKDQPIDLEHYNKIGTMSEALDKHANRAYLELNSTRAKNICKKMFKALTDVGANSRGVRRPTQLKTLCEIVEASEDEVIEVIDVFRKPSRSFLMPPINQTLDKESIIDISHESFMRIWKKLITWNEEEQESMRTYKRLSDRAMLHKDGKSSLLDDTYLRFALIWRKRQNPNAAWASRFDDNFEEALDYLSKSEKQSLIDKQKKKALQEAKQLAEIRKIEEEQQAKLNKQRAEIRRKEKQKKRLIILFTLTTILFSIAGILLYQTAINKQLLIERKNDLLEDVEKIRELITSANTKINLIPDLEDEDLTLPLKLANAAWSSLDSANILMDALKSDKYEIISSDRDKEREKLNPDYKLAERRVKTQALSIDVNIIRGLITSANSKIDSIPIIENKDPTRALELNKAAWLNLDSAKILMASLNGNKYEIISSHRDVAHEKLIPDYKLAGRWIKRQAKLIAGKDMAFYKIVQPKNHKDAIFDKHFVNGIFPGNAIDSFKVWRAKNDILESIKSHGPLSQIVFPTDHNRAMALYEDGTAGYWNLHGDYRPVNLDSLANYIPDENNDFRITSIAPIQYDSIGFKMLSALNKGKIVEWNLNGTIRESDSKPVIYKMNASYNVVSIAISPNRAKIFTVSDKGLGTIWSADTSNVELMGEKSFPLDQGTIMSSSFSNSGTMIITGSKDNSVKIRNAENGNVIKDLKGHTGPVTSVVFSEHDRYVYTGSLDSTFRRWRLPALDSISNLPSKPWNQKVLPDSLFIMTIIDLEP